MALLERESFLADLSDLFLQAAAGEGRLLFLGGEAGIGKSELLRAFLGGTTSRRLVGASDSLSTPRPLGPLLDIEAAGEIGLSRQDIVNRKRDEVFAAFLDHLTASTEPLIVVFEDVHWADEATLDLLRFLGRRLEASKVLMIASFRDDEIGGGHPLRTLMGDLATTRTFRRMKLTGLSASAVTDLAAGSDVDSQELHRRTSGNPFYVTEILASGEPGVPTRVSDAVLARVARLASHDRAVLEACAVVGFRFDPRLTMSVLGPEADGAASLERCVQAGVLVTQGSGLAFRHELARDALLDAVGFVRKRELHARILGVLSAADSSNLSSLAHHAEGAADTGAVLEFAPAAGWAAVKSGAHREAAAQFARALRFADGLVATQRAELLEAYAFEAVLIDDSTVAEVAIREALEIREQESAGREVVRDLVFLASNLMRQGRNRESHETMTAALQRLETVPPGVEHAFVRANRTYFLMLDRENLAAIEEGERAILLAREYGDGLSSCLAYNAVGSARILSGEYEQGVKDLLDSMHQAKSLGLDTQIAAAYGNLGSGLGEMYRFEEAESYLRQGSAFCSQRDLDFTGGYIDAWLALTLLFRGAWGEAGDTAAQLLLRSGGAAITRIMALLALGRVRARRGDPEAWTVLDEALLLAEQTGTLQRIAPVRAARAEAKYLAGEFEQAANEAEKAYALAIEHRHPWHVGELAYWRRPAKPPAEDAGLMAEPYALELTGDWEAAARAWEELDCPYEAARALGAAEEHGPLERARLILEGLGAGPLLASIEAKMRMLGYRVPRGPAPTTVANPANLTRREAQILKLLAEGKTNQEIAGELFRSVRTIDHHVSAVLAKLDVNNRVEATRRAGELGLLD